MEYSTTSYEFDTYRSIIDQISPCMNDYLYVYDLNRDLYYITQRALDRFAMEECLFHDVIEAHKQFVHPNDYDELKENLERFVSGKSHEHNMRYRWIGKDGKYIWINCRGHLLYDEEEQPVLMIGCINEIGNKNSADNVSGLLGETSLLEILDTNKSKKRGHILRIGIDDFKKINEKNGVSVGDQVLHDVAECIKMCLKPHQNVYRISSDEFVIIDFLEEGDLKEYRDQYRSIRSRVDFQLEKNHYNLLYTISAGILNMSDLNTLSFDEVQKISQFTLSQAKENGKNQCYCFEREDYDSFLENRNLILEMQKAIYDDFAGFEVYYQPIVDAKTKQASGAEALLRFRKSDGTMVSPTKMIPLLESSGLIVPVGKWVLETAAHTCKEIQQYKENFRLSVNLSYVQLLKSAIFEDIISAISCEELLPDSLVMELTESGSLEDNASVRSVWKKLKKHGVRIAVDDFGTGYSNLKNIGTMKPDYVKIDRSFTMNALGNEFDYMVLENVISMTKCLNLRVVIEGIETQEELERISQFGAEFIQGYYFGKPVPKEQFMKDFIL